MAAELKLQLGSAVQESFSESIVGFTRAMIDSNSVTAPWSDATINIAITATRMPSEGPRLTLSIRKYLTLRSDLALPYLPRLRTYLSPVGTS